MNRPDPLDDLLRFDPLAEAERLIGGSIHDPIPEGGTMNPATAVGFGLAQGHAAIKDHALRSRGDTVLSNDLDRYVDIIEAYGFERVLTVPFRCYPEAADNLFVYAHRAGLLLCFDTYCADHVNSGNVYYNWRPAEGANRGPCISSGGFSRVDQTVWRGNHDCREALIYNLDRLAANGELVSPWVERPFLWLLHYGDTKAKGYDYDKINGERTASLPDWVREFIGPER